MADQEKTQGYTGSKVSREELKELDDKISKALANLDERIKGVIQTVESLAKISKDIRSDGVPPEQILNIKAPEFNNFGPIPRDGKGNPLLPSEVMRKINAGEAVEGFVAGVGPMAYKVQ